MEKRKLSEASSKEERPAKKEGTSPSFKKNHGEKRKPSSDAWSKSKKKRMRTMKAKETLGDNGNIESADKGENSKRKQRLEQKKANQEKKVTKGEPAKKEDPEVLESVSTELQTKGKQSALQKSFLARLSGSRFRELNEELYTTTSKDAFKRFSSKPELYDQYHEGFRTQVEQWPINPVNVIVKWLSSNFQKHEECYVADFGCGDAELAKKLISVTHKGKCPFQIHSFDLVASCDLVTACDMSNVPLQAKTIDVAVFCLSLMGTNLADFLREAHRVLKDKGTLKIAEVRSRFESKAKKDELNDFIEILETLGFSANKIDKKNTMFVMIECKKNGKKPDLKLEWSAKPCIYKRR